MKLFAAGLVLLGALAGCSHKPAPPLEGNQPRLVVESLVVVAPDGSKSETIRVKPGGVVKTEIQVSGFSSAESGDCVGETAIWLKNSDNKVVYQDKPGVPFRQSSDGGNLTLTPTLTVPSSEPPGSYTMTVTVTDKTANKQTGKPLTITVE